MEYENGDARGRKRILKIYTVVEKPNSPKGIWLEIGVASENRDGSITGKLDCLPVSGSIQVRDWEPRKKDGGFKRDDRQQPQGMWQQQGRGEGR